MSECKRRKLSPIRLSRQEVRRTLLIPSEQMVKRGFCRGVLDKLDVGYSEKLRRTVVPLYDDSGMICIGFANERGWVCPGFPKGSHLYGFHLAKTAPSRFVLLVEGMGDVWRALEDNLSAVASLGCFASTDQVEKLVSLDKAVLIAFNQGKPNQSQAERVLSLLRAKRVEADLVQLPEWCRRPAAMPPSELGKLMNRLQHAQSLSAVQSEWGVERPGGG